jgi:AcrR family transcriptional regulator
MQHSEPKRKGRGRPASSEVATGRDAVIEATKAVLRETEPAMITRQLVAERAGVDPNLIRYYFGKMPKLLAEVVADTHRKARRDMSRLRDRDEPLERLRYRIDRTLDMFDQNPHHHKLLVSMLNSDPDSAAYREWSAILAESLEDLEEILKSGVDAGLFRKVDARFLHMTIVAVCEFAANNGPIIKDIFGPGATARTIRDPTAEFVYDMVVNSLRADPQPS